MPDDEPDQRDLLTREFGMWRAEAERTRNQLQPGGTPAAPEQAWYDYCLRKQDEVAFELDKVVNPEKFSPANVARDSLDDLERQTD
jgi:hypothetical protein